MLPPSRFAEQLAYLRDNGYTPMTVTQLVRARAGEAIGLPRRPVVLTFDDGFAGFQTNIMPLLGRYGFPATLYVVTGAVDGTSRWLRREGESDRPMLTWSQLSEICDHGIECGSHSCTHPQLDVVPHSVARDEIVDSRKTLEDRLGQEVRTFAYPFGYSNSGVRDMVREAGYSCACAVRDEMSSMPDDVFAMPRFLIVRRTSIHRFADLLTRTYSRPAMAFRRARRGTWQAVRRTCSRLGSRLDKRVSAR